MPATIEDYSMVRFAPDCLPVAPLQGQPCSRAMLGVKGIMLGVIGIMGAEPDTVSGSTVTGGQHPWRPLHVTEPFLSCQAPTPSPEM